MTPKSFTPRPYQKVITNYILDNPRCGVFVSMGMGKTASTLAALDILDIINPAGKCLIVAPLRVARNVWSDELEKWHFPSLTISRVLGSPDERKKALHKDAKLYITNFENLTWLVEHLGDKWPFDTIIVDESSKLKSFRLRQGSKRAKALAKHVHTKVERVVLLTGTPASNGLKDLWGPLWFLDKGARLGATFTAFAERWFKLDYSGFNLLPLPHAQKEIQDKIKDICLSLDAKDFFDLKEPIINKIEVELPSKARTLYKEMETELFVSLQNHEVEALNAASMTVKCLQIANGCLYVGESNEKWEEIHDAKLEALESVIEEAAGAPVLVAYNFKHDLARLIRAFPKGRVLDTNPKTIKEWNEGKIPVLFAHPASAGHGLSLQHGGNIIAFYGCNWNLEEHLQIIERIGPTRQMQSGYDRPVFIHYIIAKNTIDEQVLERLETKKSVQEILLEAMKAKHR